MNIRIEPINRQNYKGVLSNSGGREFIYTVSVDDEKHIDAIFSKDQYGVLQPVNDDYFRILSEEFQPLL
jgi:hypothetical protein